jgi:alanyl aminopeptidase
MENAGLITYEQGILLARPELDTRSRQSSFAYTAAHEIAHQWFGDLVTMAWWDDLWLNEGFATWMEGKIVGAWKPDLEPRVAAVWATTDVMSVDSLVTTRKVRQPIQSRDDIANAFDSITYQKGAAVLRMFEAWLGPTAFRDGVRRYLRKHAWGNATTADFVSALAGSGGTELAATFASFVDQPGVPLVTADLECEAGKAPRLVLEQRRYLPVGSKGVPSESWRIPISIRHASSGPDGAGATLVLNGKSFGVILGEAGTCPDWVVVNAGATGYFRVLYKGELLTRVLDNLDKLTVPERVALAADLRALVRSGDLPAGRALEIVPRLLRDSNASVRAAAVVLHEDFGEAYVPDELLPSYARFLETTYGETARRLGWQAKATDDQGTLMLRSALVPLLADEGGDTALVADARALALRWLDDGASVDTDTVRRALPIAARSADAAHFDRLLAEAEKTRDTRRRALLFAALGSVLDPALLQRAFAVTLADTLDTRESITILWAASGHRATRDLAYEFVKKHYDELTARLPKDYAAQFVYFGASFCDSAHRADVEAFFKDRVQSAAGGPRNLIQVLEGIDLCAAQRAANAASIATALR